VVVVGCSDSRCRCHDSVAADDRLPLPPFACTPFFSAHANATSMENRTKATGRCRR